MAFPFWSFMAIFWIFVIFFTWDILSRRGKNLVYIGILIYMLAGIVFFCKESFGNIPREIFTISGEARVIDGDTIEVNGMKVRFSCIDTPESKYYRKAQYCLDNETNCGELASQYLQEQVDKYGKGQVTCKIVSNDRYGRQVGYCWAGDRTTIPEMTLNYDLVLHGYAWLLTDYDKNCKEWKGAFNKARQEKRGLFSDELGGFKEPKLWRKTRSND